MPVSSERPVSPQRSHLSPRHAWNAFASLEYEGGKLISPHPDMHSDLRQK